MGQTGFKKLVAEEKDGGMRIEIEIVVDAARVNETLDEFYRLMAQVRGMGAKADDRLSLKERLAEEISAQEVEAASKDFLLNRFTMEAVRELGIDTVLTPGVHADDPPCFNRDFSFTASLTPRPRLSLTDIGPVEVQRPIVSIDESDIDAQIAYSAQQCAEYQASAHGEIRRGDYAVMDIGMTKNGKPCKDLSGLRRRVEISEGLLPVAFIENVLSMRAGEERSFSFSVPAEDGEKTDRYEAAVRLYEVQERVVPVVDDAWVARVLPQFGDVAGVRAHIRADLESQKAKVEQQELVLRVRSALEKRLVGVVPDEMYQEAKDSLMATTLAKIEAQGQTFEAYCEEHGTTKDEFTMQAFMQAAETLRQNLALDVLARERGIAAATEDVAAAKGALPAGLAALSDEEFERRGFASSLGESIRRKKALAWLMETAQVEN
ncbi:trigger factor [Raoultibacter phocaeensis]|uniref:trigger factor n=1 Tax=Raoultibacter phocaeensis TaxID=2479841 RepID=UPI00111A4DB9|nr:trigger factor [Raoultibacter phocaeensis]